LAASTSGANRAKLSMTPQLMLRRENESDAAAKMATSSTAPVATAASKPLRLGVSAENVTCGCAGLMPALMPANSSGASPICGTHALLTNDDASMYGSPAPTSRRMSSSLTSVGTTVFSFCAARRGGRVGD
jgi:hypothetical protein